MILVFGGTTEGREVVRVLDESGSPYFYSTKTGEQQVRCKHGREISGALDEKEMLAFCRGNRIRVIVDAAHPFACQLHSVITQVSGALQIPVIRYERKYPPRDPDIIWCEDYRDALRQLERRHIENLLALTGVQTISRLREYWEKHLCRFRVLERKDSIERALEQGFPREQLVFYPFDTFGIPPKQSSAAAHYFEKTNAFNEPAYRRELELLQQIRPQAVLTKESGESGFFREKISAARTMDIPVFAVKRPPLPEAFHVVWGEIGLRKKIEQLCPAFFPLRCGFTTGTCATAAAKGALLTLLSGNEQFSASVNLPSGEEVTLPIARTEIQQTETEGPATVPKNIIFPTEIPSPCNTLYAGHCGKIAACTVIKDAGDDPDVTDGSAVTAAVRFNETGLIRFLQGEGVGRVTLPGLGIPIGQPAINATPREMITRELRRLTSLGVDVTISVAGGRDLARRTFNPKLGIVDGISIIGTSGIVRPFSREAFAASIGKEIEVAKALGNKMIVINSGAKSQQYVKREFPDLPPQAFIHYGNFIGETISAAAAAGIKKVVLGLMIGKAVKLAEGFLDTHSKKTVMNKEFLQSVSRQSGCSPQAGETIAGINLARELWTLLAPEDKDKFFPRLLDLCYRHCAPLLPRGELSILLISEEGEIACRQEGSECEST